MPRHYVGDACVTPTRATMILDSFNLNSKVALVTGAASGLGLAIATGLAEAGADIFIVDVRPAGTAVTSLRALGRRAESEARDLTELKAAEASELVQRVVGALGRLDVLVNNAGIIRRAPALEFPAEDWETVLSLNLSSVFYLSQAAARHWNAAVHSGKIINLASMLSYQGGLFVPSYTAAKSGLAGLTRALANEWASLGINVNAIAPGYMETEVTAGLRSDTARNEAILSRIPAGRWGAPDDLKGAAVFLASEASNYMHGAIIPVDGGWLAR